MNDDVYILINGKRFYKWLKVTITSAIDSVARAFSLEVTRSFPDGINIPIKPGDSCEIYIGSDKVLTGYVDSVPIAYGSGNFSIQVNGRSKTCDLIDCNSPPAGTPITKSSSSWVNASTGSDCTDTITRLSFDNEEIKQIISSLCAPYDIKVDVQKGLATMQASFTVSPTDTVFNSIKKLILKDNLVVCDDENGAIKIVDVGNKLCTDSLVTGQNILSASFNHDVSALYSNYLIFGQKQNDGSQSAKDCSNRAESINENIRPRYVNLTLSGNNDATTCQDKANFELAYRNAQTQTLSVVVQGWRQSDSKLWKINQLVFVEDSIFEIADWFLIKSVTFNKSSSGTTTALTLIKKDAYKNDATTITKTSESKTSSKKDKNSKKTETKQNSVWKDVKSIK